MREVLNKLNTICLKKLPEHLMYVYKTQTEEWKKAFTFNPIHELERIIMLWNKAIKSVWFLDKDFINFHQNRKDKIFHITP